MSRASEDTLRQVEATGVIVLVEDDEATTLMLETLFGIKIAVLEIHAHYRARAEEQRRLRGEPDGDAAVVTPLRKGWREMSPEERVAEQARSRDLDRRLLAAIERYRRLGEERRRAAEAEAS